jgi:hypothetical protein
MAIAITVLKNPCTPHLLCRNHTDLNILLGMKPPLRASYSYKCHNSRLPGFGKGAQGFDYTCC